MLTGAFAAPTSSVPRKGFAYDDDAYNALVATQSC